MKDKLIVKTHRVWTRNDKFIRKVEKEFRTTPDVGAQSEVVRYSLDLLELFPSKKEADEMVKKLKRKYQVKP